MTTGQMKARLIVLATVALAVGCGRDPRRADESDLLVCSNLTMTTYSLHTSDHAETTTVHELWRNESQEKRLVSSLFADSRKRVITLIPTPITTDNIRFSAGVFHHSFIPDRPVSGVNLHVDTRGELFIVTDLHKSGEALHMRIVPATDSQRLLTHLKPAIVNITVEGGAPLEAVIEEIRRWGAEGADIRLAMIPWEWAHPPYLIEEPEQMKPQQTPGGDSSSRADAGLGTPQE